MLKTTSFNSALETFPEHAHSMVTKELIVMRILGLHFDSFTVVYGSCMNSSPKESISPWFHIILLASTLTILHRPNLCVKY